MGISAHSAVSNPAPGRPLQAIGATGAVLALAILAASVLLQIPVALGASSKLPIGIELDGPAGSDRRLLAIGLAVEALLGRLPAPVR